MQAKLVPCVDNLVFDGGQSPDSRVAAASMGQLSSLLVLTILGLSVQGQQTQGAVAGAAAGAKQSPAVVSVLDPAQYPVCVSDSDCEDISDKGDTASIV